MTKQSSKKQVKAVGLLSGGLDSILAAKIVKDLGVKVYGVLFRMPWGYGSNTALNKLARQIGIRLMTIQLDDHYLTMVKDPKYGYGTAINPCIDCHTYMIAIAAKYMREISADFLFTGEVLGQRPMSQNRQSLKRVEKRSGLEGRLLRPLSAKLLEPTIPENEGLIDRNKLLGLSGRSRKAQIQLAEDLHITKYPQPAGGCLLTDKNFSNRLKDFFDQGYQDYKETIVLQWGRHFRINDDFKAIVGRDDQENNLLIQHAFPNDHIMIIAEEEKTGPAALLKGKGPSEEVLSIAAGLIQRFSRYNESDPLSVNFWQVRDPAHIRQVTASKLDPSRIEQMYI
ncbi:MAG: tRNA 4-thiouridine(8) synthase ThiI [Candidatus Omnitrophica bacterium]|nr:tRNA 4-thiouridine(8) synthase ThiI [Candidatus Omnitrophota bacterium]